MPVLHAAASSFEWSEVNLGLGVYRYDNIRPRNHKIFRKKDTVYEPIPTLQLRFGPFFINKDGAGVALLYFKHIKLIGLALYEGEPYRTDGMQERKRSFYLGGGMRVFNFEVLYYQDAQARSRGKVLKLIYAPSFGNDKYTFTPRVSTQYWDQNYVDYFFGVKNSEVNSEIQRHFYKGKHTLNYGLMLRNVWSVQNTKYILSAGYKFYGSRVSNSPTAIKKKEQRILVGFMHKFY